MEGSLSLAFILILAGFLLMVAELFIPSGGILSVLSIGALGVGVSMAFFNDVAIGWYSLIGVFIALPIVGGVLLRLWPKTPMGKRFILEAPQDDGSAALMASHEELENLVGKIGKTISVLRPAGMVDFEGRRVDSITEGMMIQPGQTVRCVEVRAGKVLVRPVDSTNLESLETADFS